MRDEFPSEDWKSAQPESDFLFEVTSSRISLLSAAGEPPTLIARINNKHMPSRFLGNAL
jgi:hypothetical protein